MAYIKIDLKHSLTDGEVVKFKAPCDCTAVTGLKVYYVDGSERKSKVFAMKDAHGNNLAGIGDLFGSGAYLQVILNTTDSVAYLQNADTNAYLEEKFAAFQDGCDTLVAECAAYGVTPDSNSPTDIAAAMGDIYDKGYNGGVAATKVGTAVAANVLSGKTFTNASGVGLSGSMANKSGTAAQSATASLDSTNSRLKMTIPAAGYYGTGNYLYAAYSTIRTLIGLTAAKILKGNTILGLAGTGATAFTKTAEIQYTNGVGKWVLTSYISNYKNLVYGKNLFMSPTQVYANASNTGVNGNVSYDASTGTLTLPVGAGNSSITKAIFYYDANA